jgi:predicted DNA-binding WGR domain protein
VLPGGNALSGTRTELGRDDLIFPFRYVDGLDFEPSEACIKLSPPFALGSPLISQSEGNPRSTTPTLAHSMPWGRPQFCTNRVVPLSRRRRVSPASSRAFRGITGQERGANRAGYDIFPRVKSPKRRKISPARPPAPVQLPLFAEAASLIRVRPERNEWRFYRLEIWPDLFGHALLVRQWGRIGTEGRRRLEPHPDPGAAINALARLAARKRGRGYRDRAA